MFRYEEKEEKNQLKKGIFCVVSEKNRQKKAYRSKAYSLLFITERAIIIVASPEKFH